MSRLSKEFLENNKEIYNVFALMPVDKGCISDTSKSKAGLCLGMANGYFAGDAWAKGDEAFGQVSGSSFGIITGDDDGVYRESKYKMIRPSVDEILEHLENCCDSFVSRVEKLKNSVYAV